MMSPLGRRPILTVTWKPRQERCCVEAGYRTLSVDCRDLSIPKLVGDLFRLQWRQLNGTNVRTEHELLFIRRHGPWARGVWMKRGETEALTSGGRNQA